MKMNDPVYEIQKAKKDLERCGWYVNVKRICEPDGVTLASGFSYSLAREKIHLRLGLARIIGQCDSLYSLANVLTDMVKTECSRKIRIRSWLKKWLRLK